MKRWKMMLLMAVLSLLLAACGGNAGTDTAGQSSAPDAGESADSVDPASDEESAAETVDAESPDESAQQGTADQQSTDTQQSAGEPLDAAAQTPGEDGAGTHVIAVLVYDRSDDEVQSFRKYLQDYLGEIFDVQFLYSDSISGEEEILAFLQDAADYGAEGVMSFYSEDLQAEVELCADNHMYLIMASGTVSDREFAAVEDNEYFLGVIGPGSFIEYKAGSDMAKHFLEEKEDAGHYFIFSGGGCYGNEMHRLRTEGILDTLQNAYEVRFDTPSEEIAVSDQTLRLEAGELSVVVCPGYLVDGEQVARMQEEYAQDPCRTVLAVLPVADMMDTISGAKLGVVDCYSETNLQYFTNGSLEYLCGKFSSITGPSFAAMYNAVTGHASAFRMNGKAFHITQGFWASESREDFNEKYVLSSSIERNAYNYEDLQQVICVYNKQAGLDDLRALAEAYTFDQAVARRTQ